MNLIRKCPVQNPCEAESFEEAFRKNKQRLAFERDKAAALHADMKKDGDPHAESVDPEFWKGCETANNRAYFIYQEEQKKLLERVAARLAGASIHEDGKGKAWVSGYADVLGQWIKALKANDPGTVVWW